MIKIPVKFVKIDDEDFDLIKDYTWSVNAHGYAHAYVGQGSNLILMHRLIMNPLEGMTVDHINGNRLDNRRSNLRIATVHENNMNTSPRKGSSKYRGVSMCRITGKWRAQICFNKKSQFIGRYDSEIDAAKAWNAEAVKVFGQFAKLNEVLNDE